MQRELVVAWKDGREIEAQTRIATWKVKAQVPVVADQ
jgi:hypothetical protein